MKGVLMLDALIMKMRTIPVGNFMEDITNEGASVIEDKNIEQLKSGIDSHGNAIAPGYTPFTVSIKKAKGQTFDRVTLEDEGNYHRGINANVMKTGFELISSDKKAATLSEKYGDVLGLTVDSKKYLAVELYAPEFIKKLREYFK